MRLIARTLALWLFLAIPSYGQVLVGTPQIRNSAVTPAKIDASGSYTMGGLTATGNVLAGINLQSPLLTLTNAGGNGTIAFNGVGWVFSPALDTGTEAPSTSSLIKGDGAGGLLAALAGTDYLNPASTLDATKLSGILPALDGSALTALNGSNIASGTVADARLSSNVPLKNAANVFSSTGDTSFAGKVGIGTPSPSRLLTVQGAGDAQATIKAGNSNYAGLFFGTATNDYNGQIRYNNSTNSMGFYTNTTQKLVIESTGMTGLNVADPNVTFEVRNGSANSSSHIYLYPNGTSPATGAIAITALKLFGTDYSADQTNYEDFGLFNAPDGLHFNAKRNGTGATKDFLWTVQDTTERMRLTNAGALGIGATPVASAKLQIDSTTQGFLPPRMATTEREAISTPAEGLTVYDLTLHKLYCYDGSAWQACW